jgi:hypothetical protein
MDSYHAMLWGGVGGLLPDALRIVAARYGPPPAWLFRPFFWVSLLLLVCIGAGTAYIVEPDKIITALAMGYSAPSIISKTLSRRPGVSASPEGGGGQKRLQDLADSVRNWWTY